MAITTTAEYKAYRGITSAAQDTLLGTVVTAVSEAIERYCRRTFATASYTERIDGSGTPSIFVKNAPITAIASIKLYSGTTLGSAMTSTLYLFDAASAAGEIRLVDSEETRIFLDPLSGMSVHGASQYTSRWPIGHRNVEVAYTGGYSAVPNDLKFIAHEMVDDRIAMIGANRAVSAESLGPMSRTNLTQVDLSEQLKRRLSPFRRMIVKAV